MIEADISSEKSNESGTLGVPLVVGVALILCAFWMVVWQGCLNGVFHFDDYRNIVENKLIRKLWPLDNYMRGNRPVGTYSFALNYFVAKLRPSTYLLTNLCIHLSNGLLLFAGSVLTCRIYQEHWRKESRQGICWPEILISALIATVWVVHPITTQAVTYIVQRFESLSSFGYLGAWVSILVYMRGHRLTGCLLVFFFSWIGFLSKEVFVSAPLSILLFDVLISRDSIKSVARQRWLPYLLMLTPLLWFVPMVVPALTPSAVTNVPSGSSTEASQGFALKYVSSWEYLRTQPEVIWHYLYLMIWPKKLCIDYLWLIQSNPLIYIPLGCSILGLVILGAYCYWKGAILRVSFGFGLAGWLVLTFFFILAPTCSFVPIADIAFEHRMYLASAIVVSGICVAGRYLAATLLRGSERPVVLKIAFSCIAASLIVLLSWRTHLRNQDYRDGLFLWQTATEASPLNSRAWYNLGRELLARGEWDAALKPMVRAVGYSSIPVPKYDIGLAHCLSHKGRTDDAVTLLQRALKKSPENKEALNDLGVIYMKQSRTDEALDVLRVAADLEYPTAIYNLGMLQQEIGDVEGATRSFQAALRLQSKMSSATRRLAWILATAQSESLRDGYRAVQLMENDYEIADSQNAFAWDTYGAALAEAGLYDRANAAAQKALSLARNGDRQMLAAAIENRMAAYRLGQPHRDNGSGQDAEQSGWQQSNQKRKKPTQGKEVGS